MKKILSIILLLSSFLVHAAATHALPDAAQHLVQVIPGPDFPPHSLQARLMQSGDTIFVNLIAHHNESFRHAMLHDIENRGFDSSLNSKNLNPYALSCLSEEEQRDHSKIRMVIGRFQFMHNTWRGVLQTLHSDKVGAGKTDMYTHLTRADSACWLIRLPKDTPTWKHEPKIVTIGAARTFDTAIKMQKKGLDLEIMDGDTWYTVFKKETMTGILIDVRAIESAFKGGPMPRMIASLKLLETDSDEDTSTPASPKPDGQIISSVQQQKD